jgi:hypothetical protein
MESSSGTRILYVAEGCARQFLAELFRARTGIGRLGLVFVGVVEDVADASAGAFDDLAGAFGRAYSGVLGSDSDAFADVADSFDRVEGDNVGGAFAGAFGYIACGSSGSFADVASAATDIASGAAGLGLGVGWWRSCGLLLLGMSG